MSDAAIQEVYALWTDSEVNSYLLGNIARRPPDNNGGIAGNLFEMIVDEATPNGSGRWTSLEARARRRYACGPPTSGTVSPRQRLGADLL
jgi:6-phosphogluconate dehydrogenase